MPATKLLGGHILQAEVSIFLQGLSLPSPWGTSSSFKKKATDQVHIDKVCPSWSRLTLVGLSSCPLLDSLGPLGKKCTVATQEVEGKESSRNSAVEGRGGTRRRQQEDPHGLHEPWTEKGRLSGEGVLQPQVPSMRLLTSVSRDQLDHVHLQVTSGWRQH